VTQKPTYRALEKRIAELEQQVEQLQSAAVKYQTLFHAFPHGITVSDDQGKIVESNAIAAELLGVSKEEHEKRTLNGQEWRIVRLDGSDMPPAEWASVIALQENRTVANCEMGIVKPGNEITWMNVTASPLPMEGHGVVVTYSDITEKRRIETQLRDSSNRCRQFFENAGVYSYLVSPEGIILEANQTALKSLGYAHEELVGQPLSALYAEESLDQAMELFQRWKINGRVRDAELMIKAKNGDKRWVILNADAVRDEAGSIVHSTSIQVDITERKQAEQSLKMSLQKYHSMIDNVGIGVALISPNMEILELNRQMRTWFPTIDPALRPICYKAYNDPARSQPCDYCPTVDTLRDGLLHENVSETPQGQTVRHYRIISSPLIDESGRVSAAIEMVEDITDRKQIENRLWASKERFEKVFNSQLDALFVLNAEKPARVLECNKAAAAIFGYRIEEMVGKAVGHLHVDESHLKAFQERLFPAIKDEGFLHETRFSMKRKDGTVFPTEHSVVELKDDNGQRVGWISVVRDLTEREKLEARIQQAQKMEAIGTLAGGIAHDFNNLLTPIIGFAEMLIEDLPSHNPKRENVDQILHCAQRASDLVKQILAFSRHTKQEKVPVRLQQVLREVLKLVRSTIPANIDIRQEIQRDCPMVMADPTQLHQVAMNLITNSFHAVDQDGGTISVSLRKVKVTAEDSLQGDLTPGSYALLKVTDNGHGIEPALLTKIFEPYFTTKGLGRGTGLGLSVVHGIVSQSGGHIQVNSAVGQGTSFEVYLPLLAEPDKAPEAVKTGVVKRGFERILLVDDEPSVALMQQKALERLGYQVTVKTSSIDALETFKADCGAFDLVITDMAMPLMTGDRLASELITLKPDVRIIMATGFSEQMDEGKAGALGIKGFMMKPLLINKLAAKIRLVLDS